MLNDDKTEFLLVGSQRQLAKVPVVCFAKWSMKTSQNNTGNPKFLYYFEGQCQCQNTSVQTY